MNTLISLLVLVIIASIIFYLIRAFCPEPPQRIVLWIFAAICVIYLLMMLLGNAPHFGNFNLK